MLLLSSFIAGTSRIWDRNGIRMLLLPLISEAREMATDGFWTLHPTTQGPKERLISPFQCQFWFPGESSTWPSLGQMHTLTTINCAHGDWVREEAVTGPCYTSNVGLMVTMCMLDVLRRRKEGCWEDKITVTLHRICLQCMFLHCCSAMHKHSDLALLQRAWQPLRRRLSRGWTHVRAHRSWTLSTP